jgi:hypothetical protein
MTERQLPSQQPVLPTHTDSAFPGQVIYVGALNEAVGVQVTLTTEERAARIRELNKPPFLTRNFADAAIEDARLIYIKETPDGFVGAKEATAGYGKPDILIYSFAGEIMEDEPQKVQPAKFIYDYTPETQLAYWGEVRRVLDCMEERLPKDLAARVIEHNFPIISDEKRNVPRSICLPHTHVFAYGKGYEYLPEETPQELEKIRGNEEMLLNSEFMVDSVLLGVAEIMGRQLGSLMPNLDVRHLVRPFGYEFYLPKDISNEDFTRIMADHHMAYAQTMREIGPEVEDLARQYVQPTSRVLPQPSYIFYMRNEGDEHILSFSPQFVEAAGGMEGAGCALRRTGHYDPPPYPMTAAEIDALVV